MKIKDAPLIIEPKGTDKMPASDGSNQPRSLSLSQILSFVTQNGGGGSGSGSGIMPPMTIDEYYNLNEKQNTLYFIVNSGVLERVYYNTTLIAMRGTSEEVDLGFPLVFPFVFA